MDLGEFTGIIQSDAIWKISRNSYHLIENLKNPNFVKLIFGDETNIAEKFAEVDVKLIRAMEKKHCRKQKIYSSRKIRFSLRSSDFKEKLLWAFQVAAT